LSTSSRPTKKVSVARGARATWDVGLLEVVNRSLTGSGRFRQDYLACAAGTLNLKKSSSFNKKCAAAAPARYRTGTTKTMKQLVGSGNNWTPDVSIKYDKTGNRWVLESVTVYGVLIVGEPVQGAYPVFGKNVTTDRRYGVRGPRGKISRDPNEKGYYRDVARNLLLYKSATNKPVGRMYWWVKDSTMRHEKKHYELYRKWFESKLKRFLQTTATRLRVELLLGRIRPITRKQLEYRARFIFRDILQNDPGYQDTHETQVSATTAAEFKKEAQELLRKGQALEAKASP